MEHREHIDHDVLLRLLRIGALAPTILGLVLAAADGAWHMAALSILCIGFIVAVIRYVERHPRHAIPVISGATLVLVVGLMPVYGGLRGPLLAALTSPVMLAGVSPDRRVRRVVFTAAVAAVLGAGLADALGLVPHHEEDTVMIVAVYLAVVVSIAAYTQSAFAKIRSAIASASEQERRAKEALAARNAELRRREAAEEKLQQAVTDAQAASHAKSEFLANMSHELRTPLNAIIGYAEMLLEEADDPTTAGDLSRIQRSGRHLLSLINDVLDLSKIEAGRMDLEPASIELEALLDEVEQAITPQMLSNDNTFELVDASAIERFSADPVRTKQVLLNLLSNAAKFTRGGTVELRVRTVDEQGRAVLVFDVLDTGPGIDDAVMSRLFRPFVQGHTGGHHHQGTGLGLVLSRNFAQMMDGDVTATSTPGEGSTFTFYLPVHAPAFELDQLARERTRRAGETTCPVAVCVEDDPGDLAVMERRLTAEGFWVVPCRDADRALGLARDLRPALVTVTTDDPRHGGRELLARVRSDAVLDQTAVLLCAVERPRSLPPLPRVGCITKPIRRKELVGVLRRLLPHLTSDDGAVRAVELAS